MARRRGHRRVRIPVRRVRDARHRRAPPALQARTRPAVAFNVRRGVGEALDFEVGAAGHFFFFLRCVLLLRYVSSRAAQADGLMPEPRARCKYRSSLVRAPCEWMPGSGWRLFAAKKQSKNRGKQREIKMKAPQPVAKARARPGRRYSSIAVCLCIPIHT